MTTAFVHAGHDQQMIPMMTATFDGMTGQQIHPPPMPNNQMIVWQDPQPIRHSQTLTWKANKEEEDEYRMVRKQVSHIAPALFQDEDAGDIFPQNIRQWSRFKHDLYGMRADELDDNTEKTKAMIEALHKIPKKQRKIESAFGEDGKKLHDGRSTVLAQWTVFSSEHVESGDGGEVMWPTQAEMLEYGDNRENVNVRTRCGRYLPPPRKVGTANESFLKKKIMDPYLLDKAGPVFPNGPSYAEMETANFEMDNDDKFEEEARGVLDEGLLKEIGLPDWSVVLDAPPVSGEMAQLVKEFGGMQAS